MRWSENPNLPPDLAKSDKLVLTAGVTREGAATAKDARAVSIDARTRRGAYKVRVTSASPEGVTVSRVANVKTALPPLGGADILAGRPFSVTPNGLWGLDKKKGETHAAFKAMTTEPGFRGFWNVPFPKDGIVYRCDVPVKALRSLRVLTTEQMRSLFFFDLVGWRNGERVTLAKGVSFPDRALNDNMVWDVSFDRAHAPKDLDAIGWVERFDEAGIRTPPRYIRVFATEWDRPAAALAAVPKESTGATPVSKNVRGHENTEWSLSGYGPQCDAKFPRVLLVGDSITAQYQGGVGNCLRPKGVATTYWAASYCLTHPSFMKMLDVYLGEADYAVIHFNNGLHSFKTPTEKWTAALREALKLIRTRCPRAKLVWATSTPPRDAKEGEKIRELNAAAAKVVAEFPDIATDDLFATMDPLDRKEYWADPYHFKPEGKKIQVKQVAETCLKALGK